MKKKSSSRPFTVLAIVFGLCGLCVTVSLAIFFGMKILNVTSGNGIAEEFISNSRMGEYRRAGVSSDSAYCSDIGSKILFGGGNAIDAAVATVVCGGVVNLHSSGLGGSLYMTIYSQENYTASTLVAGGKAPFAATEEYYKSQPEAAIKGGSSITVPGTVAGLWSAHQQFGRLPWSSLLEPSIELCSQGFMISSSLKESIEENRDELLSNDELRDLYYDMNLAWRQNTLFRRPQLAATLEKLKNGSDVFYRGDIAEALVDDINEQGGNITIEDFNQYNVVWRTPMVFVFNNGIRLFTVPPPSAAIITGFILNILDNYKFNISSLDARPTLTYHRLIEAIKFGEAKFSTIGDPQFDLMNQLIDELESDEEASTFWYGIDDNRAYADPRHYGAMGSKPSNAGRYGSSQVSVIDENGFVVSVTSSLNMNFGSCVYSKQTGIWLNNEMERFNIDGSTNSIEPGKRPMSYMSPSVFVDSIGTTRLCTGATGGPTVPSAITMVALMNLWFEKNIKDATDARRFHYEFYSNQLYHEEGIKKGILYELETLGHTLNMSELSDSGVYSVASGYSRGEYYANADYRKAGSIAGLS